MEILGSNIPLHHMFTTKPSEDATLTGTLAIKHGKMLCVCVSMFESHFTVTHLKNTINTDTRHVLTTHTLCAREHLCLRICECLECVVIVAHSHNDTHFALVPVKADGEKRSQRSHISRDNSSLSWAVRLKAELSCCITT